MDINEQPTVEQPVEEVSNQDDDVPPPLPEVVDINDDNQPPTPPQEEVAAVEEAPSVEETPAPIVEETPSIDEAPAVEEPIVEAPVIEESPAPVVEEAPVAQEPAVEETPVVEVTPVVEEAPTTVNIPSGQPEPQATPAKKAASLEPSPKKPSPKAAKKAPAATSPSKSPATATRSPARGGDLITRQIMMDEHAAQCSQRAQNNKQRDAHRAHATNAIRTLARVGKQEDYTTKEALQAMEEEDKAMFTEIPSDLIPRKKKKQEDRAMTAARSQQFRNANYHAPPRATPENPRTIVDINRLLTPRNRAIPANPSVTGQSRYAGLSQGNFAALEQDPHYKLDAENNRRKLIEQKKDAILKSFVSPHSPDALKRKSGFVFEQKPAAKVAKDYIPAVAQKLPDGHGDEGRDRRDKAEKGYTAVAFR